MGKIALLFPGQGTQYVGMSKSLYNQFEIAKQTFKEANEVLGFDLQKLCFEGSLAELSKSENSQAAILTSSVTAFRVYMEEVGRIPDFCIGHSLGEYSALTCSGAFSFADALKIVYKRGKIAGKMIESGTGAMTIIDNADVNQIEEACKNVSNDVQMVSISCYNSPSQVAVSGDLDAVMAVEDIAFGLGAQVTPLIGSAPFHCHLMKPYAEELKEELMKIKLYEMKYPVISDVTALPYQDSSQIAQGLELHMIKPVQWQKIMSYIENSGVTHAVEMGANNVISKIVKDNISGIKTYCFEQKEDRQAVKEQFINKAGMKTSTVVIKCLAAAVAAPNFNTDEEEYQKGVALPYRRMEEIQYELDNSELNPGIEQMKECLRLLKLIFVTKKTPLEEQIERFDEILEETRTKEIFSGYLEELFR